MLTITKKLTQLPSLGVIKQEIDKFMEDEQVKRQQFYEQITEDDKAEFINGEVIMHSPARNIHVAVSSRLTTLLNNHIAAKNLGFVAVEKLMTELTRNSYEPDICFYTREKFLKFPEDLLLHPAPDFIVEIISKKTEARDRGVKFEDYAFHGVGEYWIIEPKKKVIEKYINKDFEFVSAGIFTINDVITSDVISGFTIGVNLLFDRLECNKFIAKDKTQIAEMEKTIEVNLKTIEEKEKTIEEKDKTIEEKDKTIEEKDKTIEENLKTIEEKDNAIELLKQEIEKLKKN